MSQLVTLEEELKEHIERYAFQIHETGKINRWIDIDTFFKFKSIVWDLTRIARQNYIFKEFTYTTSLGDCIKMDNNGGFYVNNCVHAFSLG